MHKPVAERRWLLSIILILGVLACSNSPLNTNDESPTSFATDRSLTTEGFSENSPYGIVGEPTTTTQWNLITDAGISWLRVDFDWSRMVHGWNDMDILVNEAYSRGINIYGTITYCPPGYSTSGTKYGPLNPAYYDAWHDFVYDVMNRYKNKVKYWGLWNEPNLGQFWKGTREQYCLQIVFYGTRGFKKFKENNPGVEEYLCLPELSSSGSDRKIKKWIDRIVYYNRAAGYEFDVITMHQYDGGDTPSGRISKIFDRWLYFVRIGMANKQFWVTEIGWPTCGSKAVPWFTQGDYLIEIMDAMNAGYNAWWNKTFWFSLFDGNDPKCYGITAGNGETKKAAWYDYRDYIASH
ncbi:MAG: hypothetical protein ACYSTZ_10355 [Planctomycetota bacterium]|jgi:hypothetical protein